MNDPIGTPSSSTRPRGMRWGWIAVPAAGALAAIELQRLVTLVRYERTLVFARDLIPGAIATAAMGLLAYLLIVVFLFVRRTRKWALALAIGWGAIVMGSSLWVVMGPGARNLWQELLLRLHLTNALVQYIALGASRLRMAAIEAGLGGLLAAASAKGFAESPRERLDRGMIMASLFYAAFYDLAMAFLARLVTPH